MLIKSILVIPIKIIYYFIIAPFVIIMECIIRNITLKQSIKEFFEVKFFEIDVP